MIRTALCSICILLCSQLASAQFLTDLQAPLLKSDDTNPAIAEQPVRLSDFRQAPLNLQAGKENSGLVGALQSKPALALLASGLVPGSAQAANGKWVRAGVYFAAELAGVLYHLNLQNKARQQEQDYERYVGNNWSVMAYSEWLVQYSQINNLNNGWEELQAEIQGKSPDFSNTTNDWSKVDQDLLTRVERQTRFVFDGDTPQDIQNRNNFSHDLPKYGSQQYYELVSKYYQFQPGWRDWYNQVTTNPNAQSPGDYMYMWNGQDRPFDLFYQGRDLAEEFNDNYRVAGNILKLLLVNHVVSAFDAYFTVKLKNSRLQADANLLRTEQISLTWHF